MELNESQKNQVAEWVRQGASIAEVQEKIDETFGERLTYMEVRFLIEDLEVTLVDKKEPRESPQVDGSTQSSAESVAPAGQKPSDDGVAPLEDAGDEWTGDGKVSVSVDAVTRPGAIVSGEVTFSDGQTAGWQLDQMGRLGLIPKTKGYQPSAADVESFQSALESELRKKGF